MHRKFASIVILSLIASIATASPKIYHKGWIDFNKNGKMDTYENPKADINDRIEDLLSQMTLEEKSCQMATLYGYRRVLRDQLPTPEWKNKIWKDGIGAIDEHLNSFKGWNQPLTTESPYIWPASKHAWALNEVQRFFVEQTRLGIPVDFTNEGLRGVEAYKATNFPTQLGLGSTWDKALIRKVGRITGEEARLLGYTNVYAPILDVGRDQRWGRYEEIYGEDPYLVGELGVQMVKGMQEDGGVAATAKHFAIYSNGKAAREGMARCDPHESPHSVENIHIYPWREVIARAGLMGLMSSYNDYDGEPIQGSRYWLYERLRQDFGFKGYVVSDSDAVEYLHMKHKTSPNMKESVRQSVEAGLNVRCTFRSPDSYILPLRELVREGSISMATIDERVRDILRVKFMVGLFDKPYANERDMERADREVNGVENNKVALEASQKSLVLLKNSGLLPLNASSLRKVLVVGPNADNDDYAHIHYGPQATESVTVYQGLKTALEGKAEVLYTKGCEHVDSQWPDSELFGYEPTAEELASIGEAVRLATEADVAVAVLGDCLRTCGENRSRSSLDLPPCQELLIKELKKTGKPLIVVLISGRPASINWAERNADAIIQAFYPGAHGGTAVAQALLGEYNPGGKLTVTFPRTVGQIPLNFPFKPNSQVDGYKGVGPNGQKTRAAGALYDFGYGLSYTSFEYSNLKLSSSKIRPEESIEVEFDITNTGKYRGDEIVQLYIHDRLSSITVYERMLRGFERITLDPGQTQRVKMTLEPRHFTMLDRNMKPVIEPGLFDIYIAASSTDIRLVETITIIDPANPDAHYSYSDSPIASRLPVTLEAGDEFIIPLRSSVGFHKYTLEWRLDSRCSYEVLLNLGGGQFTPMHRLESSGGAVSPRFKVDYEANDMMIRVVKGKGTLVNLDCQALAVER
ncbi:MAG: glycoside hydrolase family 3 C-terminal domain-containing protein [Alistipes sp.]|nr:glycoside hydrolase family 3 C-terminal domain-containing protein [Alistipes sp.]